MVGRKEALETNLNAYRFLQIYMPFPSVVMHLNSLPGRDNRFLWWIRSWAQMESISYNSHFVKWCSQGCMSSGVEGDHKLKPAFKGFSPGVSLTIDLQACELHPTWTSIVRRERNVDGHHCEAVCTRSKGNLSWPQTHWFSLWETARTNRKHFNNCLIKQLSRQLNKIQANVGTHQLD